MDLFSKTQLEELAQTRNPLSVSLFMPTFHVEAELAQNPIRLKNLLRQARSALKENGFRDSEIEKTLEPAVSLLDNESYWRNMSDGLAIFLAPGYSRIYRLPVSFNELVVTTSRFHLKPLFPIIESNNRFYLLGLSKNKVRLFLGTHFSIQEIHTKDIPGSISDALWFDDNEPGHTQVRGGVGNAGEREQSRTSFHGHGQTEADLVRRPNDELYRFFREVDHGIKEVIGDDNAPLVLAGVDYYLPIYREMNKYPGLVEETIVSGSTDYLTQKHIKQLHAKAWQLLEPIFQSTRQKSIERFNRLHGNADGLTSDDIREIIPAAVYSRVDTLFVCNGTHWWGHYDPDSNTVEIHDEHMPGDEDLLDLAALYTYLNGGNVHILELEEMPVEQHAAALFRYPANVAAEQN